MVETEAGGDGRRSYLATEISKPQNALAVSDDNDLNAPLRPVLEHLKDLAPEQKRNKTNQAPVCFLRQQQLLN
jgi:hypothetical protein